jgi:uncharacterized membrane protein
MKMLRTRSIFFALVCFAIIQGLYYAQRLPQVVGSHFDKSGSVNAWQSKSQFFAIELLIVVIAAVVTFVLPRMMSAIPTKYLNLPHEQLWLAPERREQSLSFLTQQMEWLGCALLAFLLFVMELAFRANLETPPRLNTWAFVPALLIYLGFVAVFVTRLIKRFSGTPDSKI